MITQSTQPTLTTLNIPALDAVHQDVLNQCLAQLSARARRNRLRRKYYDHRNALRDLGIAIPPSLKTVETVVGWPAKGVDALSSRLVLDGFTVEGGSTEDLGLDDLLYQNRFEIEAPQGHTSSLISSVAFEAVTAGDVQSGEPTVLISFGSAESATGLWDGRRRTLRAALFVFEWDDTGSPTDLALYVPNLAIIIKRQGVSSWDIRQSAHQLGIPVEPLVYRPSLDRPFGHSRISRAVMALTDSAVRTLLRSEVSAEFFSAPQRYVLGADENSFVDKNGKPIPAWQAVIGRILAMGRDDDGDIPTVGQFSQQSMQPHFDQLRALAAMFAAEVNLPLDSLGIVHDNPSSAEAIMRAKEELVMDARNTMRSFGPSHERIARAALRMLDSSSAAIEKYSTLRAHWADPATPSIVSASDAIVKQITAIPWLADTTLALEAMGYDQAQIARAQSERRRAETKAQVANLFAPKQAEPVTDQGSQPQLAADGNPGSR